MDTKFLDKTFDSTSPGSRTTHNALVKAFETCSGLYAGVNKLYDGLEYSNHIRMVAATAIRNFTDQTGYEKSDLILACFAHDLIEDARVSYNDLVKIIGIYPAELVFAVTDYTGKTRKERACYDKTRKLPGATYLKMCDRYANTAYSLMTGSIMLHVYSAEYATFRSNLYCEDSKNAGLWCELDDISGWEDITDNTVIDNRS